MQFDLNQTFARYLMVGLAASVMAGCSGQDVFKDINDYTNRKKAELDANNKRGAALDHQRYLDLADTTIRTAEDREQDNRRQASETVAFASMGKGQRIGELMMGGGYFTRLWSVVAGPEGHVTAWQPAEFIAFGGNYAASADAAEQLANVDVIRSPIASPALPANLDLVFTAQNYHDLHLAAFPADTARRVNAAVFQSLKPGGRYVVIDHNAVPGAGLTVVDDLHRIDVETVIGEVTAAGFVLDTRSDVLDFRDDPRTASVFAPERRGITSQFMLRFRKPG